MKVIRSITFLDDKKEPEVSEKSEEVIGMSIKKVKRKITFLDDKKESEVSEKSENAMDMSLKNEVEEASISRDTDSNIEINCTTVSKDKGNTCSEQENDSVYIPKGLSKLQTKRTCCRSRLSMRHRSCLSSLSMRHRRYLSMRHRRCLVTGEQRCFVTGKKL